MNISFARHWPNGLISALFVLVGAIGTRAQGTITFDAHNNWGGTDYYESGMNFRVIVPGGGSYYDGMAITYGAGNTPQNGTPFMGWFRQFNPYNYVSLSLTNGSLFGLSSVQLADPIAPSLSPVSISFVGYPFGGGTVTNTFTTPGNGATTFTTYTFNSDFSPTLTRVDILAPRWAMDNLVFTVPEPSVISFILLGSGVFIYARHRNRKRC